MFVISAVGAIKILLNYDTSLIITLETFYRKYFYYKINFSIYQEFPVSQGRSGVVNESEGKKKC